jgi:probable selenium-dependent hydroxylase accessory protein YqeC
MKDGNESLRVYFESELERRPKGEGLVAAFVGAGGKTSAMYGLAALFAASGLRVLLTTTTHIKDPRGEKSRAWDALVLLSEGQTMPRPGLSMTILADHVDEASGKLAGIGPEKIAAFRGLFDLVLVEADGSRGLPVKAPASHEPVLPVCADLVIGVIGLDCLGRPADPRTVHRLGKFLEVSGAVAGEPIDAGHLAALVSSPAGLFKSCPAAARRIVLLNKADLVSPVETIAVAARIRKGRRCDAVFPGHWGAPDLFRGPEA